MHHLSIVPDFRQAWKVQHQLSDILFLTVCAVICGAEGWDEIEDFGHAKLDFMRQYGDFEAGVPSHDMKWSNWSGHPDKPHNGGNGGVHDQEDSTSVFR